MPRKESSLLVISLNEEKKFFTEENLLNIKQNILQSLPSIIFVCTHNPSSSFFRRAYHFQHVLGNILTGQLGDNKYEILTKDNSSGLRTRVYYRGNSYIDPKCKNKNNNNLFYNENKSCKSNDITGCQVDCIKINKYGILFKNNCIRLRLEYERNNIKHKILVLNSDISINKLEDIDNIINNFRLSIFSEKGYNIFFCGDIKSSIMATPDNYTYNENENEIYKGLFYNNKEMNKLHYNLFSTNSKLKMNLRKSINQIGFSKTYKITNGTVSMYNRILFSLPESSSEDGREKDRLIINSDSFKILDINSNNSSKKNYISTLTCYYQNNLLRPVKK